MAARAREPGARFYCLDASACALLSEDFSGTTRWHFQRELVACHSRVCLSGGQPPVALLAGSDGRAAVVLHPTAEPGALQQALDGARPAGEGNLAASLKLALLVSRRFDAGSAHVTAFVASAGAAASLLSGGGGSSVAGELRQAFAAARTSLDIAVLCSPEELGAPACAALEALAGGGSTSGGSSTGGDASGAGEPAAGSSGGSSGGHVRLVWLRPVDTAAESWEQLEPALEQLEGSSSSSGGGSGGSSSHAPAASAGAAPAQRSALPRHISRAPRQFADPLHRPRASLLAPRSGVQQPALCRGESLSRLGHLSSDGMMRPWLPTYASLGRQAAAAGRGAAAAGGGRAGGEFCYIEVQPLPKWRTLLSVAAGRMLAAPSAGGSQPGSARAAAGAGSGDFSAASSELLRSLEALTVLDEEQEGGGSSSDGGEGSRAAPAPVRFRPDSQRGTLRLLQGVKEPRWLKLVWSAEHAAAPAGAATPSGGQPALDMFAAAEPGPGGAGAARSGLLSYMPAAAVEASAARGPIIMEGCELWEAAAEFEWELPLPTAAPEGDDASEVAAAAADAASRSLPAAFEARALPNGAQLLLVTPSRPRRLQLRQRVPAAAAFWLQQRVQPDGLQPPTYGTGATAAPAAEQPAAPSGAAPAEGSAADPASRAEQAQQQEQEQQAATEAQAPEGSSALLAAAVLRMLREPPPVDLRRFRRDVKSGALQVTPLTVGPLPAQFVRDIVLARSQMMGSMGVENLDSWGEEPDGSSGGEGGSGGSGTAKEAGASGEPAGSTGAAGRSADGKDQEALQQHKKAAWSLLRQRLHGRPGARGSGAAGTSTPPAEAAQPAAAAPDTDAAMPAAEPAEAAQSAGAAAPPISCSSPQATPSRTVDSCSSSATGTPYGTPFNILPSLLVHQRHADGLSADAGGAAVGGTAAGTAGAGAEAGEGGGSEPPCLPSADAVKRDGPAVLVGPAGQGEGGDDRQPTLFQFE